MLIDMHFHLESQFHNPDYIDQTIEDIERHKMLIAANSCNVPGYQETIALSKRSDYILPAFGILPWYAHQFFDKLDTIELPLDEVGMLGEIGIDYKYSPPEATKEMQKALYAVFLKAAEKHDLIVNVHIRGYDTMDDAREMMGSYDLKRVIMHSYYDRSAGMRELVERGYYFTIGQAFINPEHRDESLLKAVDEIPNELLLVETDCVPSEYVLPSTTLKRMHEALAEYRDMDVSELRETVRQNSIRLMKGVPQLESYVRLLE
ncbi:MAG: TatD family hydrolase [Candidatus Thorarchaeota archaeon]